MQMHLLVFLFVCLLSSIATAIPTTTNAVIEPTEASSSESSPNPIASLYPFNVTGTINSTISVIPIPYKLARSIIPSQYGILTKAYEELLPGFPPDSYPLVIRGALDHDVGLFGLGCQVPDFQRISLYYPFVDLLGDGYSSFTYALYNLITSTNLIALGGAASYGEIAVPANFTPSGQAYGFVPSERGSKNPLGEIFLSAYTNSSATSPAATTTFTPLPFVGPWPLKFYVNVTNQPSFTDGLSCDNQLNLFNTTLSTGKNVPVDIVGEIMVEAPYFPITSTFQNVFGIKVDIAFIENNGLPCSTLKGYSGTGSGD